MRSYITAIVAATLLAAGFSSCIKKKDTAATPSGNGEVKMEFFNNVGSSSLNLGNQWYTNQHGDSFMVSKFNYYISNIQLTGSGVTYTEANSYHLIQQSDLTSTSFDMSSIPYGVYSSVTLTIGVDSLHDVSGAQTGALDPTNGMFWAWNTGYIMLKFEGTSPKAVNTNNVNGNLVLHAGGFSGPNSVLRTVTLTLTQPITVSKNGENHIHLTADVLALFKSPNVIDFSVYNSMQDPGPLAKELADNYANMFTITYAGL